jgi:hypothetical protein
MRHEYGDALTEKEDTVTSVFALGQSVVEFDGWLIALYTLVPK